MKTTRKHLLLATTSLVALSACDDTSYEPDSTPTVTPTATATSDCQPTDGVPCPEQP